MEEKYFPLLTINGNVDNYVDEPLEIGNFKGKIKPVYLEEPLDIAYNTKGGKKWKL